MRTTRTPAALFLTGMLFLLLIACDRQGPMGPPGEPGPDGGNAGGGIGGTYVTKDEAIIKWQVSDGWGDATVYELAVNGNSTIQLPDSLYSLYNSGAALLVYFRDADQQWHESSVIGNPKTATYDHTFVYSKESGFFLRIGCKVHNDYEPFDIEKIKVVVVKPSKTYQITL